jgi:hypothetical protein
MKAGERECLRSCFVTLLFYCPYVEFARATVGPAERWHGLCLLVSRSVEEVRRGENGIDLPAVISGDAKDGAHIFLNVINPAMDALNSHRGQ